MARRTRFRWLSLFLALLAGIALAWRHGPRRPGPPDVAIEDGRTIDFSSGRAVVRDTPADRAALERAQREMDAAAKDVTFAPAPTPAAATPRRD